MVPATDVWSPLDRFIVEEFKSIFVAEKSSLEVWDISSGDGGVSDVVDNGVWGRVACA